MIADFQLKLRTVHQHKLTMVCILVYFNCVIRVKNKHGSDLWPHVVMAYGRGRAEPGAGSVAGTASAVAAILARYRLSRRGPCRPQVAPEINSLAFSVLLVRVNYISS